MTCIEKYMKKFPNHNFDNVIAKDCPGDHGYQVNRMYDGALFTDDLCSKCWNQEDIGVTADDVEEKTWDCDTCVHQRCAATTFTDGSDPIIDHVCGYGNSIGELCKNIVGCDKYEKIKTSLAEKLIAVSEAAKKATDTLAEASRKIKDSGERRQFETGAVRDIQKGKGRCDLLPLDVVGHLRGQLLSNISDYQDTGDFRHLFYALQRFIDKHMDKDVSTTILEVSKHFEDGAKKYGEYNWQKGIPTHCYIDSAVRHYLKYLRGDTDEPHDRAFVWNILCCIWTCIHKPELNDYRKGEEMFKTRKELKQEIGELKAENDALRAQFDSAPNGCKPGRYCEACIFSEPYHTFDGPFGFHKINYLCKKGDCPSIILKSGNKAKDDDKEVNNNE